MTDYQICTRCIMDTTDPHITFDAQGVCSHCKSYDIKHEKIGYKKGPSEIELERIVKELKDQGKNKQYDCIVGISGGVDSSYLLYLAHSLQLRPLAVHVDAGWNSDIAVRNIQKICNKLQIDLHTIVIDWPTIKELQRAFMFSGLPNLDIPQDHCFLAAVYKYARKYNIKYMLNGSNLATEGILPASWGYTNTDYTHIKSIYKTHGRGGSLRKYPHFGLVEYYWMQSYISRINPLNYIDYSKSYAIETLEREFGWTYYGGKHFESRFTKYFQSYYQPVKFGFDKRRAHLSSLIVGGELSRAPALEMMNESPYAYPMEQILEDQEYILKKLDIEADQWVEVLRAPAKSVDDYASQKAVMERLRKIKRALKR